MVATCLFLTRTEVEQLTRLPTSTLYAQMKRGKFPRPIKLTLQRAAWLKSDIDRWLSERIAERDSRAA